MTQEDVIEMAIEGHASTRDAIRWAMNQEREACAQILANTDLSGLKDHPLQNWVACMLFEFIKVIQARGEA